MSVRRHIAITVSARYFELVIVFIYGIFMSRLLSPEEFGIYSVAASLALLGTLLRNVGIGQFIVQADSLDEDMLRASFSFTLMMSWGVALVMLFLAPLAGEFYGNSGVMEVLSFLALNFFLLPFGAVSDAVLQRNMEFKKLGVISVSSAMFSLVVGVSAAWLGASYMAIAWATNARTFSSIVLNFIFRPSGIPWLPGLKGIRRVSSFGFKVGGGGLPTEGVTQLQN